VSELVDTTEMYLKSIWEMEEDGVQPLRARIVERLGHSVPTVSQTIGRMERDGLLTVQEDRSIQLTPLGAGYAMRIMRKHRLAELLLTQVIGMPLKHVHDEACRWEHVMSKEAEERIVGVLTEPFQDPFGNPVPGLSELGLEAPAPHLGVTVPEGGSARGVVVRLGEPIQADPESLEVLLDAGVLPGVEVELSDGVLRVAGSDDAVTLPPHMARHLALRPVE